MSKVPSLYDLYGPTSLLNLERSIADGKMPTGPEIATQRGAVACRVTDPTVADVAMWVTQAGSPIDPK